MTISSNRSEYEGWVTSNRPEVAKVPKSHLIRTEFTTITDSSKVSRPILDYFFKAGDWDGVVDATFVFDIDANGKVTGIHEERLEFIAFPPSAPYPSPSDGGRLRHSYTGLKFTGSERTALFARLAATDDFDDLRERSTKADMTVLSCFVDTDHWNGRRAPTPPPPTK